MQRDKPCLTREMTYRGLECWTKTASRRLDEKIQSVVTAVLDEQDRQWKQGINVPDIIASSCRALTQASENQAFEVARQDAHEAQASADNNQMVHAEEPRPSHCRTSSSNYISFDKHGKKSFRWWWSKKKRTP
jgi:hypothetical protein